MYVEQSRIIKLPDGINENYDYYQKNWNREFISQIGLNKSVKGYTTLSKNILNIAGVYIKSYFKSIKLDDNLKILEPFAGNGVASKIIHAKLLELDSNIVLKSTDVQNLTDCVDEFSHPVEFGLNSVQTIEKYKNDGFNVLMMISPPPNGTKGEEIFGYGDYFAIKNFHQLDSSKYLFFIGELGASDGSEGMYQYLLDENSFWELKFRELLYSGDDFFGGKVEKELFIFKKKTLNF
jgi:hypothetical protein